MTQIPLHASGVIEAPSHATIGNAEANAFQQTDQESMLISEDFSPQEKIAVSERVAEIKELLKDDLSRGILLGSILPEDSIGSSALFRRFLEEKQNNDLDASGSKRIELRASSDFVELLNSLCRDTGLSKADVIRRGVSLYARALLEKTNGRVLSIAALEDNQIKVKEIIQV